MSQPADPYPANPTQIPAATVIVVRRSATGGPPELMMMKRASTMRFAGGAVVFPGGRVDPADEDLAARAGQVTAELGLDSVDAAARVAAVRETLEEAGLVIGINQAVSAAEARAARAMLFERGALLPVIEAFGWSLALEQLVPFAHWCPPFDGGFDTRFYVTDLGSGKVEVAEDGTENTGVFWSTAREVLEAIEQGRLSALFPTLCNLHRIAQHTSFAELRADALAFPPVRLGGTQITIDGVDYVTIPEGRGYPVTRQVLDARLRRT